MTISRPTQPLISATDTSWKISYMWEQLSGPGVLTFSNPSIVNPFISASVAGTYTARISATDAAGNRSSKTLSVIWSIPDSLAPVIRVGNPLTAFSPTQVRDVTATDSDSNLIYKWDQISGPGRLTFTTVDRLLVTLTV